MENVEHVLAMAGAFTLQLEENFSKAQFSFNIETIEKCFAAPTRVDARENCAMNSVPEVQITGKLKRQKFCLQTLLIARTLSTDLEVLIVVIG
jgi:hypothetical protein